MHSLTQNAAVEKERLVFPFHHLAGLFNFWLQLYSIYLWSDRSR